MDGQKVLLLGAGGLMGRHLAGAFRSKGADLIALRREDLDIRDSDRLAAILDRDHPAWVINAAAVCDFDRCEADPNLSLAVNFEAPVRIAHQCRERGIRMVQFSSDYIFNGRSREPYDEEAEPGPLSVYGKHKAALEHEFSRFEEHLIARLAWVFGIGGKTFMSMMPDLLMTREEVRVAAGKRGSCLHAGYGADAVIALIRQGTGGLVNVVHSGDTGWEEFAAACLERLRAVGLSPACRRIVPVPFQEMAVLRPGRPDYSVLSTGKLEGILGRPVPRWETGLKSFLKDWEQTSAVRA